MADKGTQQYMHRTVQSSAAFMCAAHFKRVKVLGRILILSFKVFKLYEKVSWNYKLVII
jgi:hypothetical protein